MRITKLSTVLLAGCLLLLMPLWAQIQNPIQAAKDAYNKARQQQQQQQQQQKQQQQTPAQQAPQGTTTQGPTGAADTGGSPSPAADSANAQPVALDPSKMPDVVGVRVGMPAQEGLQVLHKTYPSDRYQEMVNNSWPAAQKPYYGFNIIQTDPLGTADAYLSYTAPPGPQIVWRITRFTHRIHTNRAVLLAALRQKYGKETVAFPAGGGHATTEDSQIGHMVWLYDESGARVPAPLPRVFPTWGNIWDCQNVVGQYNPQPAMPEDESLFTESLFPGWCRNFVGIHVSLDPQEIVESTGTEMMDVPLAIRTAHAATVWKHDLANKLRQEDLQKSKQAKPSL